MNKATNSHTQAPNIAFIGECMIELQRDADGTLHQSFAGDTLNTAVYLARLLPASQCRGHYVTALGTDHFSQAMLQQWQAEGIECDKVRRIPDKLPGVYYVDVDASGERTFLYWRGQSAARYLMNGTDFDAQLESLAAFDYLYLSGISLAILLNNSRHKLLELVERAKKQGATICFDNNYRPQLWRRPKDARYWYRRILRITDIAFLTFDDEQQLWNDLNPDQVFERCRELGIGEVVIKRGTQPCLIETWSGRESVAAIAVPEQQIADTNAAGDSFSAGYLAGRLRGCPAVECATLGHRIASVVIQHRGAIIPREAIPDCACN